MLGIRKNNLFVVTFLLSSIVCYAGNIYKVKDYGILPNGEDVSDKLTKLTSQVSRQGGGIILFNEGTYVFGSGLQKDGTPYGTVRLYPNITYRGVDKTVLKANLKGKGFYSLFSTSDNSVENLVFEGLTFDTYIGSRNRDINDYRLAIKLHYCKNVTIRNCKFIHDIGTIDTRYNQKQEDKDEGNYRVNGLIVENCIFEAKVLSDTGYRDITVFGICAQNVIIRNNHFCVTNKIKKNQKKFFPNCCLEIQGKDMWIYGNEFRDFTNAIDYTTVDNYDENRNINIYQNHIYCFRGIALWCRANQSAKGIRIHDNNFKSACDNPEKRVNGLKGSIVFISHPTGSTDGVFSDISITNNVFDYDKTESFYQAQVYNNWIKIPQNKTNTKSGMTFTEFYAAIDLGGSSACRDNIIILGNTFNGCVFPAIYAGGKNVSSKHLIKGNIFRNCSIGSKYYIITLSNHCDDFCILDNTIIDSGKRSKSDKGKFFTAGWSGLKKEGYSEEENIVFKDIVILNNKVVDENGNSLSIAYESDFTKLDKDKNNIIKN